MNWRSLKRGHEEIGCGATGVGDFLRHRPRRTEGTSVGPVNWEEGRGPSWGCCGVVDVRGGRGPGLDPKGLPRSWWTTDCYVWSKVFPPIEAPHRPPLPHSSLSVTVVDTSLPGLKIRPTPQSIIIIRRIHLQRESEKVYIDHNVSFLTRMSENSRWVVTERSRSTFIVLVQKF